MRAALLAKGVTPYAERSSHPRFDGTAQLVGPGAYGARPVRALEE